MLLDRFFKKIKTVSSKDNTSLSQPGRLGFDDLAISTLWDVSDEPRVDRELAGVRTGKIPVQAFEDKLMRYYNDQTVHYFYEEPFHKFEPLEQTPPKHDLVVNSGLIRIAQLVTGKSTTYFTYFGSGTGVAVERPSDFKLSSENFRVSMLTSGFAEATGTVMKFVGKFPTTVPSGTITEGGAFDIATLGFGTMLFRTLYPVESRIRHTRNSTFYSLMQSINQVSVT